MRTKLKMAAMAVVITAVAAIGMIFQGRQISDMRARLAVLSGHGSAAGSIKKSAEAPASAANLAEVSRILAMPDRLARVRSLIDFAGGLGPADLRVALEMVGKLPYNEDNKI